MKAEIKHQLLVGLLGLAGVILGYFWLAPYFSGERTINPVLLNVGPITIYWYGALMALAVIVGFIWLNQEAGAKWLKDHLLNLVVWGVIAGIVGARLTFVLLDWSSNAYNLAEMINLQGGGMSIHGAVIGAALSIWIYARINQLVTFRIFDSLVPALVLGQIIGRFGNFFNQEAFGSSTTLPWKMFVAERFRPEGLTAEMFFHPTFLYAALGLVVVLFIVMIVRRQEYRAGAAFLAYILSYSLLRFGLEFFRVDSVHWGLLTVAQWVSLLLAIVAIVIGLVLRRRRNI